jgi:hypothetical protein
VLASGFSMKLAGEIFRMIFTASDASQIALWARHPATMPGNKSLPHYLSSPVSARGWRRVHLQGRQGLAHRLRSELREYAPQRADARRERVAVVLDDIVKL